MQSVLHHLRHVHSLGRGIVSQVGIALSEIDDRLCLAADDFGDFRIGKDFTGLRLGEERSSAMAEVSQRSPIRGLSSPGVTHLLCF